MGAILDYPVQLGIAYLFLAGYLLRTLFVSVRLPASVGVILSGFVFSFFLQQDIFWGRDHLQELAFFLVLLTAGLEIQVRDLKLHIFVMAWLPATFELLGIAVYAVFALGFTKEEGLVLGTVLVCIGDGLVIPKMKEFSERYPGHPLPRLVFMWAPLEASYGLTLFGILVGLSAPANQPSINMGLLVLANIVRILATLGAGIVLGAGSGWLITRRTHVMLQGQQVFTGAGVEAFLMVLAVALLAFGIGASEDGKAMVPICFSPGSLFQPELLVIVTGTFFAVAAERKVLHQVEGILGGVWVFGQLVLFSMLGSRTTPDIFPKLPGVLPIMAVGLLCRLVGVFVGTFLTLKTTSPENSPFQSSTAVKDSIFCFLSTLPRATIQGALGAVPVTQKFFTHAERKHTAQDTIFLAARLYIVFMSVCGMILLNTLGPALLDATAEARPACRRDGEHDRRHVTWTENVDAGVDPLQAVCDMYALTAEQVYDVLRKAGEHEAGAEEDPSPPESLPRFTRSMSDPSMAAAAIPKEAEHAAQPRLRRLKTGLVFAQFDMPGSHVDPVEPPPPRKSVGAAPPIGSPEKSAQASTTLQLRPL